MDQTGEQLIALITPQPLTELTIGAEPLKLTDELVTKWEQAWGATAAMFERANVGGRPGPGASAKPARMRHAG